MVLTVSSRKFILDHLTSMDAQIQDKGFDGGSPHQHVGLLNTNVPAPYSPVLHSFRYIPKTSYSPPSTPPDLIQEIIDEQKDSSIPSMPSTPRLFSPISTHDDENSFPWSRTASGEFSYTRMALDPCAQPFVPARPQFAQKHTYRHAPIRRIPQAPLLLPARNRSRLSYRAKSDRVLTSTVNPCDAHFYSAHFPAGHALHRDFVRKYAPGGQIGVGAFGFVVTGRDKLLGHEVAVKFIEKDKVPSWGWSFDPEMGHVPTEAVLLKLLDHPGIIKFLDFFQDRVYFYLVQELHGSPWRGKHQLSGAELHPTDTSFPIPSSEHVSSSPTDSGRKPLSQSSIPAHQVATTLLGNMSAGSGPMSPSYTSSSSSTFSSPSCSPVSPSSPTPVSPASPLTPPCGVRPNMGRRQSHDLFECIEEYQRLSESQARYIFAQVVDVVHYLDSIGVTHRDIKDENVLIDRFFRVKLIDFGAASCVDPRAPRPWYRHFRGTLAYAPAEIFKEVGKHQAEPADIWALGILLSYLITGKSAFPTAADAAHGRITLQNCTVRAENETHVLSSQGHSVSSECWHLLTRCLDPDPHTRASIAEVKVHPWLYRAFKDEVKTP